VEQRGEPRRRGPEHARRLRERGEAGEKSTFQIAAPWLILSRQDERADGEEQQARRGHVRHHLQSQAGQGEVDQQRQGRNEGRAPGHEARRQRVEGQDRGHEELLEQRRQPRERRQAVKEGDRQWQQGSAARVADVLASQAEAVGDPVPRVAVHERIRQVQIRRHQPRSEQREVEQAEEAQGDEERIASWGGGIVLPVRHGAE
jgi:hypothetical protein